MGRRERQFSWGVMVIMLAVGACIMFFESSLQLHSSPEKRDIHNRELELLMDTLHSRVDRFPGDTLEVDETKPSWRPWRGDPQGSVCLNYKNRFGRGLTPVLLVSIPCSGSTWLRYLLEGATGFFTGSLYNDTLLYDAGFLGEKDGMHGGRTLVQRTHGTSFYLTDMHDLQDRYEHVDPDLPTILLLRDPARAIISYWKMFNLEGSNKHVEEIPESRFEGEDFRSFVAEMTLLWEELATDRLLWCRGPLHVIHYGDLVQDPMRELRQVLRFLRVPEDEGRLACVASHMRGSFKRNSSTHFDPFIMDEKLRFTNAVGRVNRLLRLLDYPLLSQDAGFSS
ncbi:sialate:O-sulfotransferase 1-like [Panulirus ornatus]|uniref:sialate:O-sulfotransferase 1-like n=1 Tax=Panulirus ornatus TaxID=150431 RepID=UPI003A8574D6